MPKVIGTFSRPTVCQCTQVRCRSVSLKRIFMVALKVVAAAAVSAVVVAGVVYWEFDNLIPIVGRGVNYVRFLDAPKGTLITEHGNAKASGKPSSRIPSVQFLFKCKPRTPPTVQRIGRVTTGPLHPNGSAHLIRSPKTTHAAFQSCAPMTRGSIPVSIPVCWRSKGRSCSRPNTISFRSIPIPARRIGASTKLTRRPRHRA